MTREREPHTTERAMHTNGADAAAISLNPDDARHLPRPYGEPYEGMTDRGMVTGRGTELVIQQVVRPPAVRRITDMHIPCECGRPLVDLEDTMMQDVDGYSLGFEGVCLSCGVQRIYYVSPPRTYLAEQTRRAAITKEVRAIVDQVMNLRRDESEPSTAPETADKSADKEAAA
jgi:hypothetical protein